MSCTVPDARLTCDCPAQNMMFALRRKYHALLAVADFLKAQETESK